ncbi:type IV toxin-antitoxin system AbiEi family antitoxin domain-containing protein [Nocardia sp. 004]|uniref:type IV toxin-antitoxin system AbiEi family antitoxin domain-containing protein n=1 Tax=Nocardia sp. 004 TaxID=3385978 RepID=UPI0039A2A00C
MAKDGHAAQLVGLASEQWGLVTSRQAGARVGVSPQQLKQMADAGMLERVRHGMYRVARFPYDERQAVRVAWMALDPERVVWERLDDPVPTGVVSHRSAAVIHGLGDVDADVVELTALRRVRLSMPEVEIHRAHLDRDDWQVVDGLAVTTPLRTIADLATSGLDAGHLAGVVRDGLARSLVTPDQVIAVLSEHAHSYGYVPFDGRGFLDALIEMAGVPSSAVSLAQIAGQHAVADAADTRSLVAALEALLPPGQLAAAFNRIRNEIAHGGSGAVLLAMIASDPALLAMIDTTQPIPNAGGRAQAALDPDTVRARLARERTDGQVGR